MKNIIQFSICFFFILHSQFSIGQFTHADTLRGSNGPGRNWWDVTKYDLHVKFNVEDKSISGWNKITFKVLGKESDMQIDMQEPMIIDSILVEQPDFGNFDGSKGHGLIPTIFRKAVYTKSGNAYFIQYPFLQLNIKKDLIIYYHGKPQVALNPPWNGGIIYKRDEYNNPWISIACQGLGASVWYPCKDYQGDEPDSAELNITAPSEFVSVANGKLRSKIENKDGTSTYSWAVVNPINNYDIIPYIGRYVNFNEVYKGEKGNLNMNYWVLDYNLEKAKKQFADAPKMMKAFEYWFGPYPFYEDGYKLVEAPHPGMEHQSAIAYGNHYQNGYYKNGDLSASGWGLKWDYIIVHESAHEWFGNNITTKDIADMWVHEGFADYAETLFTEYYYGKQAANEYVIGLRKRIENDKPIIGPYGVNKEGSVDMYYKGSNMIHTIRQVINDDEKFRNILIGLNKTFYHQTVITKQIEEYISKTSGKDLSKIFDQYLRTTMIPTLEYKIEKARPDDRVGRGNLFYRWTNCVKGFNMPVKILTAKDKYNFIYPTESLKQIKFMNNNLKVDDNFYIYTKKL